MSPPEIILHLCIALFVLPGGKQPVDPFMDVLLESHVLTDIPLSPFLQPSTSLLMIEELL